MSPSYVIPTHTNKLVRLDDPKPEDIDIEDIAHALPQIVRWGGQGPWISVAAHSVAMALYEQEHGNKFVLECLLHDAAEAYLGDQIYTLKAYLRHLTREQGNPDVCVLDVVHDKFNRAIGERYGLPCSTPSPGNESMLPFQKDPLPFVNLPRVHELDQLARQAEVIGGQGGTAFSPPPESPELLGMIDCYATVTKLEEGGTPKGKIMIAARFLRLFQEEMVRRKVNP